MKNRNKAGKYAVILVLGILLCSVWTWLLAAKSDAAEERFVIDAQIQQSNRSTYDILLTIENLGEDWEGLVRLMNVTTYGGIDDFAYDTVLALPQGSKKQFTVRIPKDSIRQTDGLVRVTLLDKKKSNVIAQKDFNRLLQGGADALTMGILSDAYSSLTYLDMGGNEIYCDDRSFPIKLVELNQSNLIKSLDTLNILVIDSYDTGILTDEAAEAVEQWNNSGGALIIGTGDYGSKTLSAFDYLNIQVSKVYPPGSDIQTTDAQEKNAYVDVSQLHMAKLRDTKDDYYTAYGTLMRINAQGYGAVGILPYALLALGKLDISAYLGESQEGFVREILENIIGTVGISYGVQNAGYYTVNAGNDKYIYESLFEVFGNGANNLHFDGLKLIVVIYVIFVGPILYLILRFIKKRDYYWWTVPIAAFVGILLIYWAGMGYEVVNTKVYSVTLEDLSGNGEFATYIHCYDAEHKEWSLNLAQKYEYAGIAVDNYYGDRNPYYFIRQEGDRLSFGANPVTSFEDCYFQAGGVLDSGSGAIVGDIQPRGMGITGTVTNNTNRDFVYFAVIQGGILHLYRNLPKGETCDLSSAVELYNTDGSYSSIARSYLYDIMRDVCNSRDGTDVDVLAALGMGVASAYPEDGTHRTMIIGVTEDWDKAVDDNCSETSYACLYTIEKN